MPDLASEQRWPLRAHQGEAGAASDLLSADDIADLNTLSSRLAVHGDGYNAQHMGNVGR